MTGSSPLRNGICAARRCKQTYNRTTRATFRLLNIRLPIKPSTILFAKMVDVKKRTEQMKEAARKQLEAHIRAAKENEGKPQFPLSVKLKAALPLVAIVVALYSWSYYYMGKQMRKQPDLSQPPKILTDVKQIFAPEEKTGESGPAELPPSFFGLRDDDETLLDDKDKRW